ncbi:helix-turn-helix transcriptional regulator [Actinoplanes sp. TBRC 11911]|uniref:helix-turn-helix transcriptional regulator n=1 Tax=Actinoplanes sp. TBRC 11911 TaxID=2729386 RepID=UPI00145D8F4E|nr:helix-turn-helix transcriptional regulator [Actinoplanes sp. TBRC 11911]NMO56720.1 helix-turn-helix transcriptional regulator [Actinoplanes sp. TBRC 11911]
MTDAVRPNAALGDFLRSRRALLDPAVAGVVSARRRQVRGLRREELAELAGMSVDYYTRLEQGRHTTASPSVLDAIARALRLPAADHAYLRRLAEPASSPPPTPSPVRPETRHLMAALDPAPAVLLNRGLDVLGTNRAFRLLYADFGEMPASERNLIRWMLTEPAARRLHGDDWSVITADMIGILRLNAGRTGPVGTIRRLVDDMSATSDLFRRVWDDQRVSLGDRRRKRLRHPQAGTVEFGVATLLVRDANQVLMVLTPDPGSDHEHAWRAAMAHPM